MLSVKGMTNNNTLFRKQLERLLELPIEPYPKMTPHLMNVLPETRIDSLSPTPDIMRRIRR
jgi:hypothetical protein